MMLRARRFVLLCLILLAATAFMGGPATAQTTYKLYFPIINRPIIFEEGFDIDPSSPTPWNPDNWDVTVHSRDYDTFWQLPGMPAQHGADCSGPPNNHWITNYEDVLFNCRNHMMTAINGPGYAMVYFAPDHMVHFGEGEAIIQWDMSTARTSTRDWMDVWITPMQGHSQLPLLSWLPDLNGPPPNTVQIELQDIHNSFTVGIFRNFNEQRIRTNHSVGWETFLAPSATRRDTFEIRISRDHIRVGMPDYNFYWIDQPISPPLNFNEGVVQFGHHSYNPKKSCNNNGTCGPNTIHWDNVHIEPAVPFTIIKADRRWTAPNQGAFVNFPEPAPEQGYLRFTAYGTGMQVSFNGGNSWQPAQRVPAATNYTDVFRSYWMPIPAGTTQVRFSGNGIWGDPWHVRDVSIWSEVRPAGPPIVKQSDDRARVNFVDINLDDSVCRVPDEALAGGIVVADGPWSQPAPVASQLSRRVANYHGVFPDADIGG
ncbi:MAG: hypothetical protein KDE09_09910 [Anaerolineales bacterium]|nr:hypothetical protein [Anaerolineales bacterium]MCB0018091.1 hypothetical protein [Anaerolineales bacterium]